MLPSLRSMERIERLERRRPPRFTVANMAEIMDALHPVGDAPPTHADTDDDPLRFASMPMPVLVVGQRDFAPDLIWSGLHFVSARLRDALGLGPEAVEYRDVDAGGSEAAARAADYKAFRVVHEADPVDLAAMYGHEPDRNADGRPTAAWLLSVSGPHAPPRRMVWREGFVPPAPLFRDLLGRLIATGALAEQVARWPAGRGVPGFDERGIPARVRRATLTARGFPGWRVRQPSAHGGLGAGTAAASPDAAIEQLTNIVAVLPPCPQRCQGKPLPTPGGNRRLFRRQCSRRAVSVRPGTDSRASAATARSRAAHSRASAAAASARRYIP